MVYEGLAAKLQMHSTGENSLVSHKIKVKNWFRSGDSELPREGISANNRNRTAASAYELIVTLISYCVMYFLNTVPVKRLLLKQFKNH
jgi:hypothetical protein